MRRPIATDRRRRREDWAGISGGALSGAMAGLLAGLALGGLAVWLLGLALGAITGGVLGRAIVSRTSPDEWDMPPPGDRPNVGMHAPDAF